MGSTTNDSDWRVASYVRLSREDGMNGESNSISSQRKIIEDWAREQSNVALVAEYVDDGYSGATFDRPGFNRMIADARNGKFNTIVVKDLSRFGRSYLDCGSWIERELPRMGIRLFSVSDDFDSMTRWDYNMSLLLPMKNLINEMQVITTSEKVRTSLSAKRARGECVANFAPYGYEKNPFDRHRLVPDPLAADVVRRVFSLFLGGESASCIARRLNSEGIPSPAKYRAVNGSRYRTCFSGKKEGAWHASSVLRILRNETYTGALIQGKTRRISWRTHVDAPVQPDMWQKVDGVHEAIVSKREFLDAQELLDPGSRVSCIVVPILGQLYCGNCKSRMRRIQVRSSGKTYAYYACSTHRKNSSRCKARYIREEKLVAAVSNWGFSHGCGADARLSVLAEGSDSIRIFPL